MNQTQKALYALIRIALIEEIPVVFPESVDWIELLEYAKTQGCGHRYGWASNLDE